MEEPHQRWVRCVVGVSFIVKGGQRRPVFCSTTLPFLGADYTTERQMDQDKAGRLEHQRIGIRRRPMAS
jgi:hypothetical protein